MPWIAALLIAALQEPPTPRNGSAIVPRQEGPVFSLNAEGKLTLPIDGEIVPSTPGFLFTLPVKGTSYEDIFSTGAGFCLDATVTWEHPSRTNQAVIWHTGGYLRVAYDVFDGERDSDEFGNFFFPRSWEIVTALVGFRGGIRGENGLFAEGRVGLGPVYYRAVRAMFALEGGPTRSGEILAPTVGVASELGIKLGYRSEQLEIAFGMNLEIQGGPHRGADVSTVVKPDAIVLASFTLGVGFRF